MSVRRGLTWLATVGALVGVLVPLAAAPAAAAREPVRVNAPGGFSAGGSPATVTVRVSRSRRDDGCVRVRTVLGLRLAGLSPEFVEVSAETADGWRPVAVSAGEAGLVVAERTAPKKPVLCPDKSTTGRYRVRLLAGAPAGRVTVIGEAYAANGGLLGRGSDSARITGRTGQPTPTERESEPVAPTEEPEPTEEAVPPSTEPATVAEPSRAAGDADGGLGIGTVVMVLGVVLVAMGAALLVLLIRRGRVERTELAGGESTGAGGAGPTTVLPTSPVPRRAPVPRTYASGAATGHAAGDRTMILPAGGSTPPVPSPPPGRPGSPPPSGPPSSPLPGVVRPDRPTSPPDATMILPRRPRPDRP